MKDDTAGDGGREGVKDREATGGAGERGSRFSVGGHRAPTENWGNCSSWRPTFRHGKMGSSEQIGLAMVGTRRSGWARCPFRSCLSPTSSAVAAWAKQRDRSLPGLPLHCPSDIDDQASRLLATMPRPSARIVARVGNTRGNTGFVYISAENRLAKLTSPQLPSFGDRGVAGADRSVLVNDAVGDQRHSPNRTSTYLLLLIRRPTREDAFCTAHFE